MRFPLSRLLRAMAWLAVLGSCLLAAGVPARAGEEPPQAKDPEAEWNKAVKSWYDLKAEVERTIGPIELSFQAVGYYDWHDTVDIAGQRYPSVDGAGVLMEFDLIWRPVKDGFLKGRLRYGKGRGATAQFMENGATLGIVNEIASDMTRNHLRIYNLFYQQGFFNNRFFLAVGKVDSETYIDQNAYANDEFTQFMDQSLAYDPILDNEDMHMPMVAMGGSPVSGLTIQGLVQSSTQGGKKDEFDDVLATPLIGVQAAYETDVFGRNGTYRLVGLAATYGHEMLNGQGTKPGTLAGVNFDQQLTDKIGVFGRAYWHDEQVYDIHWAFSGGVSGTGLVPGREDDVLGLGAAFLVADDIVHTGGTETHLEAYYKVAVLDWLDLTPDVRYVIQPQGCASNDNIFTAALRMRLHF